MNLGKSLIVLVLLFSVLGVFTFAESLTVVSADSSGPGGQTWIKYNQSNVLMSHLTATITVKIRNKGKQLQYFKISQVYYGGVVGFADNKSINFTVTHHDGARKMIDPVNPELGGDWGWPIQPGQTETIKFTVFADGQAFWIANAGAVDNKYWPLIPDMGLYTSWFMPNEIETLNPDLDLQSWSGTFSFKATNIADYFVHGIIRGPIIPTDSKLVDSDPDVTFLDNDITLNAKVAAWDIDLAPGATKSYVYTYDWPSHSGSGSGNGNNNLFPVTTAKKATTVPSQTTGVPYGLLAIAVLIVGAGLGYAKFLR